MGPIDINDAVLRRLTTRMWAAYTIRKRAWLRAVHGTTEEFDWSPKPEMLSYFVTSAKMCRQYGAAPEEVVHAAFEAVPAGGLPPRPQYLARKSYVHKALMATKATRVQLRLAWRLESGLLRNALLLLFDEVEWPELEIWKNVLCNEVLEVSPLTRYCVAHERKLSGVASYYFPGAAMQYALHQEAYEVAWRRYLPKEFAAQAVRHYETVVCRGITNG